MKTIGHFWRDFPFKAAWSLKDMDWTIDNLSTTFTTTTTVLRFSGFCPGLPRWAGTRKVKPIWIYCSKGQWVAMASAGHMQICISPRQITTPASHHSVFYRPHALPAAQPTASKHWRHYANKHKRKSKTKLMNTTVRTARICVCITVHNTTWNSSDNLPSYPFRVCTNNITLTQSTGEEW